MRVMNEVMIMVMILARRTWRYSDTFYSIGALSDALVGASERLAWMLCHDMSWPGFIASLGQLLEQRSGMKLVTIKDEWVISNPSCSSIASLFFCRPKFRVVQNQIERSMSIYNCQLEN